MNALKRVFALSAAAGLAACAYGGAPVGADRGGLVGEPYEYVYDPGQFESAQGTLMVVTSEDGEGQLIGRVGAADGLDHTATAEVFGAAGAATVTLTVADQPGVEPAMAIFRINGDLRQIVEQGEVTFTGRTSNASGSLTTGVTGCWNDGWSSETTTENVEVVAVADEESQTIDLTFVANFRRGDGEVVGHAVLSYAEVPSDEVDNGWW